MLRNCKLYLILDTEVADYDRLLEIAEASLGGGVDIIQLRDKKGTARETIKFSQALLKMLRGRIPLVINDRVDLALVCGADGVHVGQDDIPIAAARKILGKKFLIGASAQSLEHARKAQREGADYIGFGSVFKTLTKPARRPMDLKLLTKAVKEIKIPVFAIGGISFEKVASLRSIGVKRIAVCRSICLSDRVSLAVRELKKVLAA